MTGAAVEPANGVKPAIGVVLGVVLNDRVGRAPEAGGDAAVPAPVVGRANVARGIGELVGAGVFVDPGETVDMGVDLTAPEAEGSYTATWQMQSDSGAYFGTPLTVVIEVQD